MNFQQNSEMNFKLVNWRDGRTDTECTVSVCVCTHTARSFIYLDESCTPLLPVNTWLAAYWSVSAALWPPIGQLLHLNLLCKQRRCHNNLQFRDKILVSILRIKDQVFDSAYGKCKSYKSKESWHFLPNACPWWQSAGCPSAKWPQDIGHRQQCCWGHSADPTNFIMLPH